jgi:hypothetical protein
MFEKKMMKPKQMKNNSPNEGYTSFDDQAFWWCKQHIFRLKNKKPPDFAPKNKANGEGYKNEKGNQNFDCLFNPSLSKSGA